VYSAISTLQDNLAVNTVGTLAVTQAFLPLLRKGQGRKIWTVSSIAAQLVGGFSGAPAAATCEHCSSSPIFLAKQS
jgi:NAD(P)-dependent dehydrogenase (short-subunit alcohol dehydrogenase family)